MEIQIIPIVIGLTQLVKQLDLMATKYMPLVALVIAGALTTAQHFTPDTYQSILQTFVWGLTASGLYGAGKEVLEIKK